MWIGQCNMDFVKCPKCGDENPSKMDTVSVNISGMYFYFYCSLCKTMFYLCKLYSPVEIESAYINPGGEK